MTFTVIDPKTNKAPDLRHIALTEEWASGLMHCNMDCFALDQDGLLILLDTCGHYTYCPSGRFKIVIPKEY